MLTNSQKEHLTYTAVGQGFTLLLLIIFTYQYIIPGISDLSTKKAAAQTAIDTYQSTLTAGISFTSLSTLLAWKAERAELIRIIQSDPGKTEEFMTKPTGVEKTYLEWIKGEIGKTDEDKKNLLTEKAKLNSIIPTMSPISGNIDENNITLKQYVRFIEDDILNKFNFDTNVPIGMQWITFGDGNEIPKNLGMFDFRLDFIWTNSDIIRFIDYINTAGKPDILSYTGAIATDQIPTIMSNPLITMESFSIAENLDADNPTKENRGRATLRFYVRGISKDDLTYLKENVKLRQEELWKKISDTVKTCEKDPILCASYNSKIVWFQKKYQEYMRASGGAKIALGGSDEIYVLNQSVNTLKSLEKEFETLIPKQKIK